MDLFHQELYKTVYSEKFKKIFALPSGISIQVYLRVYNCKIKFDIFNFFHDLYHQ